MIERILVSLRGVLATKQSLTTRFLAMLGMTLLFFSPQAFASEKPVWVESEGMAIMGEIETPKEVMNRAKIDAQNKAVEKAVGVFIRSHPLVSNSQLKGRLRGLKLFEPADWAEATASFKIEK